VSDHPFVATEPVIEQQHIKKAPARLYRKSFRKY